MFHHKVYNLPQKYELIRKNVTQQAEINGTGSPDKEDILAPHIWML